MNKNVEIPVFSIGKPSKKKFAMALRDAIGKVNDEVEFEYDAEAFALVGKSDSDQTVNLTNLYVEHCQLAQSDRSDHLMRIASIFSSKPPEVAEDFDTAKAHLRPKIWNRSTFDFMKLQQRIEGSEKIDLPLHPVGSHLYSTLVYDTEHSMRSLSYDDLAAWGVGYGEAFEIACRNLEEDTVAFAQIGEHFMSSATGDSYDSSRVMLLDRVKQFEVSGHQVAVVPQRDAMYLADSTDEQSLAILFELTEKTIQEEPRPLCPLPMQLVNDEWIDWVPPKNHVLRKRYDLLQLNFLAGLYRQQKELLDELYEFAVDEAAFVATFSAMQKEEDSDPISYCVWGEGVDTLLPRTQMIMLVGDEGLVASGEWEHVASVVGDLLVEDKSHYPTRYRAREFPSVQQQQEIGILDL